MDLTADTVTEDALVTGYTAHDAAGNAVGGANPYEKTATDAEVLMQEQLLDEIVEELAKRCVVTEPLLQSKTVTPTKAEQTVRADTGYDGLSSVVVEAAPSAVLQAKTVTPSKAQQIVTADAGYDGLSSVTVNASPSAVLQSKTVTPSKVQQTITPDAGYDGLSSVIVGATQGGEGAYGWRKKVGRLPSGYTEVEYLQSTGTQYINMGISVPHASEKTIVEFAPMDVGNDNAICGHAAPTWSWATNVSMVLNSNILVGNTTVPSVSLNVFCKFEYTKTYAKINDGTAVSLQNLSYTDGYNNTLFYASTKYGKHKVKSYKLYNGSTLVRDLVPCTNASGVAGMYDLVNSKFYTNAGSGAFTVGAPVAGSTVGYVVSDNANAYPNGGWLNGYYYEKL